MSVDPATVKYGDVFRAGQVGKTDPRHVMFIHWEAKNNAWWGVVLRAGGGVSKDDNELMRATAFGKYPWELVK